MSDIFLIFCFLSLKDSSFVQDSVFYITSKALFFLEIFEFYNLKFHDAIKCLSMNKAYILRNNLRSKHSLVMRLDQFM